MRTRYLRLVLTLMTLLATPTACSRATPTPPPQRAPTVAPTPTLTLQPRDHTPKPDVGIVQGMLFMEDQPAAGYVLYLARLIRPVGEGMGIAALDAVNAPRAESDSSGYFVFLDVPPAQYALAVNGPLGPVFIQQGQREILAEVQAGKIADLGDVRLVPFM